MPDKWAQYAATPAPPNAGSPSLASTSDQWQQYAQPMPQMSAQPPSTHPIGDWLHNLDTDMTEGGNRTLPGLILGHMQGRGNEGYTGLNSGGNAGTAQFMGSPELGPIHAAQGVAETPDHPIMGPIHAAEGVLQTGAIPGAMMGGEGANAAIEAIPSRAHAIGMLKDIEGAAHDVPVSMSNTAPALDEFKQYVATGGRGSSVMSKLGRRISNLPPIPEAEAAPITNPSRLLGGGTEETLLHSAPDVPSTPSRPITLHQPNRPMRLGLPRPSEDIPMSSHADMFPDQLPSATSSLRAPFEGGEASGMGPGDYIGQVPGERGGLGQVQGVLRRPRLFDPPPAPEPSEFSAPLNFPEARNFYTNISRATAKPGFLRRAIESPAMPSFRMEAGNVRNALHGDLTEAAGTIGRGDDYADAIKEYAQNAKMRSVAKKVGMAAVPAAAAAVGGDQLLRYLKPLVP